MQKNNLCHKSIKVPNYEETDSFSKSNFTRNKHIFDPTKKSINKNKQKHIANIPYIIGQNHNNNININKNKKFDSSNNNKNIKNKILKFLINEVYKPLKLNYLKRFELNGFLFNTKYFINNNSLSNLFDNEYLVKFYSYKESKQIIPKKEFYFYHHMIFLERPNFKNLYFNKIKKNLGLAKLDVYQIQRKKEINIEPLNNINKKGNENKKIFDTNVLETIENYSTTMTQEPNNEKQATLTPFEIFKRCEDTIKKKKNIKNPIDQKSTITFSESEISYKSKNIADESLIAVVKDLSEKPNKFKLYKQDKKEMNNFIKKKDIEKIKKNNNKNNINSNKNNAIINSNNKNNNINNEKDIINKKRICTSSNKKIKNILIDMLYQNTISKYSSKKESFINNAHSNKKEKDKKNNNFTSFGKSRKNKGVLNLKKESYKIKSHATKFSDNYILNDNLSINNNINSSINSKLISSSCNNIDKLFTYFFMPKNKKQNANENINNIAKSKYEEFNFFNIKKRQIKKNTTLTIVNNNLINKSQNSQEKYKKISNFKSKSPLTRLFLKKNESYSNSKKNNIYKKKKSVLVSEFEHNSQITKTINKFFFEKNIGENRNISSNFICNSNNKRHLNIMALSHAVGNNRRNSYQYMKLNKHIAKK